MSTEAMTTSVIICGYTLERWEDICRSIRSAQAQQPAANEIVVVVDHNRDLETRVKRQFPGVVVVENREGRGLSGARNTGVAGGSLLMFLDDDAVAHPEMLAGLRTRCEQPYVLGAGAHIEPDWRAARPSWFPDEFLWVVGCSYTGQRPGPVRNVLGAAMCIRREVFDKVGGFNRELGRSQTNLPLGCEETELCLRARNAFPMGAFIYDPLAVCLHKVSGRRLTWRYFAIRCYAEGLSKAYLAKIMGAGSALSTERSYVMRTLSRGIVQGGADLLRKRDPAGPLRSAAILIGFASAAAGYLVGRVRYAGAAHGPQHDAEANGALL